MDYATFAAFTVWLFLILFAGMGVYRLLKTLAKGSRSGPYVT